MIHSSFCIVPLWSYSWRRWDVVINDDGSKDLTFLKELASLACGAMGLLGEAASPHVNTQEPERLIHIHLATSKASQGVSVRHAQLRFKGSLPWGALERHSSSQFPMLSRNTPKIREQRWLADKTAKSKSSSCVGEPSQSIARLALPKQLQNGNLSRAWKVERDLNSTTNKKRQQHRTVHTHLNCLVSTCLSNSQLLKAQVCSHYCSCKVQIIGCCTDRKTLRHSIYLFVYKYIYVYIMYIYINIWFTLKFGKVAWLLGNHTKWWRKFRTFLTI